jgi:acyl-CoA synthetase (AMP-forming)/AMP-acid ligase II
MAEQKAIAAGDVPAPTGEPQPALAPCFMAPTPLFHVTACNCILHAATASGAKVVLMGRPVLRSAHAGLAALAALNTALSVW